jgi:hypothetical protein
MPRRLTAALVAGLSLLLIAVLIGLTGCWDNPQNPLTVTPCGPGGVCVGVTFPLVVDGVAVTDATQNDFVVAERPALGEDFVDRPLCCFEPPDHAPPISVVLCLDRTISMSQPYSKTEMLNTAAHDFINQIRPQDRVEILDFHDGLTPPGYTVSQPFTSDKAALNAAIDAAVPSGRTAAWKAASQAVQDVLLETNPTRAVLLVSNGEDNASYLSPDPVSRGDLIAQAQTAGLAISTIALQSTVAESDLRAVALGTGGVFSTATTAEDLQQAFQKFEAALDGTYGICWVSGLPVGAAGEVRITYLRSDPPTVILRSFVAQCSGGTD